MDSDESPRRTSRRDLIAALAREDLDPFSQGELEMRIALLQAEIVRVRARIDHAVRHRAGADALFRR